MTKTKASFALAAPLLSLLATAAYGGDTAPQDVVSPASIPDTPRWAFQVTPYVWATGMEGDVSPFRRAPTIHVEKDFSDILDNLNLGGFVNFLARKDRFVVSGDVMYVNLTEGATTGPLPIIGATNARYNTAQFTAALQAGYRFYDTREFTLDVLGGARIWHLWNDLNVNVAGRTLTVENDFGWIDPILGARAHFHLNDKISLLAQGDFGGFGAGSDFTWQALATVNYSFNDKLTLSAGYKALSVDYNNNGRIFDTTLSGPVMGLTYRF